MTTEWLIRLEDGSLSRVKANFRPPNAVIEAPIDVETGLPEDPRWLTIEDQVDDLDRPIKVPVINQILKDQIKMKELTAKELKEADDLLAEFRAKRQDLATQSRAFLRYLEGDSRMLNDLSQAIRFVEYCEYKRGIKMSEDSYFAIVSTGENTFEIQEFPMNQRPSNLLAIAPAGFGPGDEAYLTKRVGGGFDIDWEGRLAKFEALEKSAEEARKTDEWNQKSPLERIKDAFLGGN